EAPAHAYGFTCPKCVGEKSQEAVGYGLIRWNYKDPDTFSCRRCGAVFPNPDYPETLTLQLPRRGQSVSYYLNPREQADPDNRSGALAWHWVGHPIHVSFSGILREKKISFMRAAVKSLALAWLFTEDPRYAVATRDVLLRFAECYRQWPYRDYWDTYADCDPLYAAWHDKALPLEWKRHLSEQAFKGDTLTKARMLQNYWGAGRVHPSTDGISGMIHLILAYDLTYNAVDSDGRPVWDDAARRRVERDLLLEYAMGAEPYVGGPGEASNKNNKAPRIYNAFGALGKCLGIPEYVDVALRGYERVRDASFLYDGFSTESPSYTNMYLSQLLIVPESLQGYTWPEDFSGRSGTVDLYGQDAQLRLMYESVLDTLLPDGSYLPLSDTHVHGKPSLNILQMGTRRYPEIYGGVLTNIHKNTGGESAVFNLSDEELHQRRTMMLRETVYPAWKTAILRHGAGRDADTLTLAFNPHGGHRPADNLALFYEDGGRTVLGDLGYMGDMPLNRWIRNTASHNLVIVDGAEQEFDKRSTSFEFMATSTLASVVEATSTAYPQCSDYRRRVVLVKTGANDTFAIDLFSVAGGGEHRYRVFSELASSAAVDGALLLDGVSLPEEAPLPKVGNSLTTADIYGLRDVRSAKPAGETWQATWQEKNAAYRLWMASPIDRVEASNGPGQRTHGESGRRVRYVDAVRMGDALKSTFVAVHEPRSDAGNDITSVKRLAVDAGPAAVALKIDPGEGADIALNNFDTFQEVAGIGFQGSFALIHRPQDGPTRYLAVGATTLRIDGKECASGTPVWRSAATTVASSQLNAETPLGTDWSIAGDGVQAYARIQSAGDWTGISIESVNADGTVMAARFPLPEVTQVEVPATIAGVLP
ncbi:MAG: heparinase II/III-family protein, partial [Candidatus Hydrogenedentes bacterium]|nr:heparinase II/III-family protein [Candidatus Hydrogenedentota bacterium]